MSNSATRYGGAHLFLTTLARTRIPGEALALIPVVTPPRGGVERRLPANVDPRAGVKLQSVASRSHLGVPVEDSDLHPKLIQHQDRRPAPGSVGRYLPQRRREQARLQADRRLADLALELRARGQGSHGVDGDEVERVGPDELVDDLEGRLARLGLRDEQLRELDSQRRGVDRVERVFGVDQGGAPAVLLDFGDGVQRDGGFPRRLGPVDLDDAALGEPAAEGDVEGEGARGDGLPEEIFFFVRSR